MSEEVSANDESAARRAASNDTLRLDHRSHVNRSMKANLALCAIIGLACASATDGGVLFQIWYFAMAAYWSATLLVWYIHRKNLSEVDLFVARWGFLIALVTVPFLMSLFWWLYRDRALLREWILS